MSMKGCEVCFSIFRHIQFNKCPYLDYLCLCDCCNVGSLLGFIMLLSYWKVLECPIDSSGAHHCGDCSRANPPSCDVLLWWC